MVMMQLSDRDGGWPRRRLVRTTRGENRQSYSFALFLVMAVLALWLASGRFTWCKVFRAQSSFVLCDSAVTTNAAGKIVLPQYRRETGAYQDLSDEAGFLDELPQLDEHGYVSGQGGLRLELAWQVLAFLT